MKNTLLTIICALFLLHAEAQTGFHLGLSGTFNSTWILNQNNYQTLGAFSQPYVKTSEMDYRATWGGNGGLVLGYNFTQCWGIRTEVQYNVTGQKYEDAFYGPAYVGTDSFGFTGSKGVYDYVNAKRNVKLHYIQIPVMFKFTSKKGRVAKFFLCMGPQIGIRTYAFEEVKVADRPYIPNSFTAQQKFKPVDIGLALQFGTDIYVTDHFYIEVGLSAYGGLNDLNGKVLKDIEWYSQNDSEYQKSYNFRGGLMVGAHYIFGEGRIDY